MQELDMIFSSERQLRTVQKCFLHKELKSVTHVRLQTDKIRKPLQTPYSLKVKKNTLS